MKEGKAVIACDVFREEIERLMVDKQLQLVDVEWLEMGLHDNPDQLRTKVQERIAIVERDPSVAVVLLAYGQCGNGLVGIEAQRCPLVIPRAHDCVSIFLGGHKPHEDFLKKHPGTYFYSPGWIREKRVPGPDRENWLRKMYRERYPDDPEMVEELIEMDGEAFSHHERVAYVDLFRNPEAESYCRGCARFLGWDFERLEGDPSFLADLLTGPWEGNPRFVLVHPGARLGTGSDGLLTEKRSAQT